MNSLKKNVLGFAAFLLFVGMVKTVRAANEGAKPDGSFGLSQIGVSYSSTETRRIMTDEQGNLRAYYTVRKSTFISQQASTVQTVTDNLNFVLPSTSNPNVYDIAWPSQPIHLTHLMIQSTTSLRVRLFDSRGSTDTSTVGNSTVGFRNILDITYATGGFTTSLKPFDDVPLNVDITSGICLLLSSVPTGGNGITMGLMQGQGVELFWDGPKR